MDRIPEDFFARPAEVVAKELIGMNLHRVTNEKTCALVVETGAYEGEARRSGKGLKYPPGIIHVHVGMGGYKTLAISTDEEGKDSAVTLRKALGSDGLFLAGPAMLTRELLIYPDLDEESIEDSFFWLSGTGVDPRYVRKILDKNRASNCLGYFRLDLEK